MSGKAVLGRRIMDWAFVGLTEEAAERFFGPNKMFAVPDDQAPKKYDSSLGPPIPEGTPLTEFGSLEKGKYYLKLGRSTGVTAGICNGALACCSWTGRNTRRYDHNGKPVDVSQEVTEEFVIVSKKRQRSEYEQASFAESDRLSSTWTARCVG